MKNLNKVKQGKRNKINGGIWERKVREDLEEKGWVVTKWMNQVDLNYFKEEIESYVYSVDHPTMEQCHEFHKIGKLIPAKSKWAGPRRPMMIGQGFPDFVAFKIANLDYLKEGKEKVNFITNLVNEDQPKSCLLYSNVYENLGVEAKSNGILDKEEKEKCIWLLKNKVFSKILIAQKKKEGRKVVVEYVEFEEKYGK